MIEITLLALDNPHLSFSTNQLFSVQVNLNTQGLQTYNYFGEEILWRFLNTGFDACADGSSVPSLGYPSVKVGLNVTSGSTNQGTGVLCRPYWQALLEARPIYRPRNSSRTTVRRLQAASGAALECPQAPLPDAAP